MTPDLSYKLEGERKKRRSAKIINGMSKNKKNRVKESNTALQHVEMFSCCKYLLNEAVELLYYGPKCG